MTKALKLSMTQGDAIDQLHRGRGFYANVGITNMTNSALERRGLAKIETSKGPFGWVFTWKLTDEGKAVAIERAERAAAFTKRVAALTGRR